MDTLYAGTLASALLRPVQLGIILCIFSALILKDILVLADRIRRRNPSRLPFPPGPKGHPIIGNLLDMPGPDLHPWRVYAQWSNIYGDIMSLQVLGRRIVILNSVEAVQDLLEKKSANYSDRPRMPMVVELMGLDWSFPSMPYGQWWRRHRRCFNQHFNLSAVLKYQSVQAMQARIFLQRLLHAPENFLLHIREALASSIMNVAYGIQIQGFNDPYIKNVEEIMEGFGEAGIPGAFLVDTIPALKYVPSWFPGAGFKKKAARWARASRAVRDLPFDHVTQQLQEGTAAPSLATSLISALPEGDKSKMAEETAIAKNVTGVVYLGAADTTISSIQAFFLAMSMYPEVQRKAQAELDRVVGSGKHPEFNDRPLLPYLNAIVKETLRWQPVVPLGLPHVATNDDVYRGYFIPKGTILLGNVWSIMHDENVFVDPEAYCPERYLKDGQLDLDARQPEAAAFGFGRRICPGRHFADNSLFILAASTLHAFNISPCLDDNGERVSLSAKVTSGAVSYPEPFEVDIKPRSAATEALVRDTVLTAN